MNFLHDAWYVAARADELGAGTLLARRLLDQPVVLFRDSRGAPAALHDRCPHRFAPLSRGRLKGDAVECGYHGLRFDGGGRCVESPQTPGQIPPRARVERYAVVERQSLIWIWMGEAEAADMAALPDFPLLDAPDAWRPVSGYTLIPGDYLLAIDNLLDLSHPEYLHDGSLGSPALKTAHYRCVPHSNRVIDSNRWFDEGPIPPALETHFPTAGKPVEHWVNMRWSAPANLWLELGATFTGRPRSEGLTSHAAHLLTPETGATTHYFWSALRSDRLDDHALDAFLQARLRSIFEEEDIPMIAAVEANMGGEPLSALHPLILPGDQASLRVRRAIETLIAEETAAGATRTPA